MRPNNPSKRPRGRSRSGKSGNPLSRSYESNGPDVKIRGSALQVADKYAQLARDAHSSGDRVMAENYFQHAEHYYRIVAAAYEQNGQPQPRERHDDDRPRHDDNRGRGNDQPNINRYDGIDDDDDDGVRRAIRVNGSHPSDGRDDDQIDDRDDDGEIDNRRDTDTRHTGSRGNGTNGSHAEPQRRNPPRATRTDREPEVSAPPRREAAEDRDSDAPVHAGAPAADAAPTNAALADTSQADKAPADTVQAETVQADAAQADTVQADGDVEAPPKAPRRRAAPRSRSRTRRTEPPADGAPQPSTEPSESTS